MAIWTAAVGCAISFLTRSFGHLSLSRWHKVKIREMTCEPNVENVAKGRMPAMGDFFDF